MNIKNWNGKKKVFAMLIAILFIVGLIVTIYLVQTRLETRTRAEKATVLSFTPTSQTAQVNEKLSLDVNINPGVNQVDYVKMVINFDPSKFDSNSISFTLDSNTKFKRSAQDSISNGQIIITLDVGGIPVNVIRSPQKIGTLNMVVGVQNETQEAELISGETKVIFNEALTQVRSIGETDTYLENVLSSTTPATIIIEAVCRPDIATCSWDGVENATSYHYVIKNVDSDKVILDDYTTNTFVDFTISEGISYSCSVTVKNECGEGKPVEDNMTCGEIPVIPTPTATPSGTTTPTPSLTVTPTLRPSTTPTVTPSLTPAPRLSSTPTLTPTPVPASAFSPTPTTEAYNESINYENTPTPTYPVENTPTPSIEPTGNPVVMIGAVIGGVLVLLGGLLLLAL